MVRGKSHLPFPWFGGNQKTTHPIDCHEDYIQQEEANVDCIPAFEESCSSPEPHLLIQGDLNDLVCDLNLSDKQHEFLLSILK